jgi:hypothetical protein
VVALFLVEIPNPIPYDNMVKQLRVQFREASAKYTSAWIRPKPFPVFT